MKKQLLSYQKMVKSCLILVVFLLVLTLSSCGSDDSEPLPFGEGMFTTQAGSANISGELFLPDGKGPFPVVIIVPGSGNGPKEESYEFNDIFLQQGIAIYHYDKRNIGTSTGSYPPETIENPLDFLNARRDDVIGIIELLVQHTDIDNDGIGLFGSSQGGWVNSLVYDMSKEIDFIMMSVGGVAPTRIENIYDRLTDDPTVTIEAAIIEVESYEGDLGFNPIPIINQMDIPVLWLYGAKDRSHPALYDIRVLEELNKDNFTVFVFENSNHEMIDVNTGQFEHGLFPSMINWLTANVK